MGQEGKRNTKDIDILRREQFRAFGQVITGAAQATTNDLFAKQLAGKRPQAQNMCDRLGIPALGQHTNGNYVANLFAGLTFLADSIHHFTQSSSGIGFSTGCGFCLIQRLGINAQGQVRVAKFRHRNPLMVERILDTRCGFGTVGNGNHNGRNRAARIAPRLI